MYTTINNLQTIIPYQELCNLTNDNALSENINEDVAQSAIAWADEIINSYLRNKYLLPLKSVPQIVVNLATDIASYRLYSRRPRKLPEHIENNYKEAVKILSNINKEEMILDLPNEHEGENVTSSAKRYNHSTGRKRKNNSKRQSRFDR